MKKLLVVASLILLSACIESAQAATIAWSDWTATPSATTVEGTLNVDGSTIGVTFSGQYAFAQTNGGANYWNPSAPYISTSVDNAPPASDIIAFGNGGSKTITFSQTVKDPVLALVSWNDNTVDFGVPIEILSFGHGYWGSGTPILNSGGTGFYGSGEVHGVIRLPGAYSSITFTDTYEYWHGLTVGVTGLPSTPGQPSNPVPEPATMLLFGSGIAGLARIRLKRKK